MFTKVLVANRGEIAVRVIRACRELGVTSVAVYSELDSHALHVRLADEAYALGGETAAESYLNTDAVCDAIERSGADAVHPGYGFFSENADFARRITEAGVTFIGPPPAAIDVMGDKISARKAASDVGVRGVPGTDGFVSDATEIAAFADEHGFPIAIKAAFGGGGRGMKVVERSADIEAAMESAQREALAYFGRSEIYVERYLSRPRHVEVQLLGDNHGNYLTLGTRDCSAQRRHQKLIEEAPAPGISAEVSAAMCEAAVKVARGCGYTNAGTVEFLYEDGEFYYLEMNTRLQVEHPVTEMVTGIDLVEQQLRLAAGEELSISQDEVTFTGHAIEVRINAEDPANGAFLPCPGPITALHAPAGFGTRWDSGYEAGDEISQYYDNLVGKLVCWGRDRPRAIARTLRALAELRIEGVATTIPADIAILEHPDFGANEHSTKWVEDTLDLSGVVSEISPPEETDPPLVRREIDVEVNGKRFDVVMWVPATPARGDSTARRRSSAGTSAAVSGGSGRICAPMQGTIVKVVVAEGQAVDAGATVVVLEAMKMENNLVSDVTGTVTSVNVSEGDKVGSGDELVLITPSP